LIFKLQRVSLPNRVVLKITKKITKKSQKITNITGDARDRGCTGGGDSDGDSGGDSDGDGGVDGGNIRLSEEQLQRPATSTERSRVVQPSVVPSCALWIDRFSYRPHYVFAGSASASLRWCDALLYCHERNRTMVVVMMLMVEGDEATEAAHSFIALLVATSSSTTTTTSALSASVSG
jgi:hypothetical protein